MGLSHSEEMGLEVSRRIREALVEKESIKSLRNKIAELEKALAETERMWREERDRNRNGG